jgi:hypothetical protein
LSVTHSFSTSRKGRLDGSFHLPPALDPAPAPGPAPAGAALSAITAADTAVPATTTPDLTRNSRLDTGI